MNAAHCELRVWNKNSNEIHVFQLEMQIPFVFLSQRHRTQSCLRQNCIISLKFSSLYYFAKTFGQLCQEKKKKKSVTTLTRSTSTCMEPIYPPQQHNVWPCCFLKERFLSFIWISNDNGEGKSSSKRRLSNSLPPFSVKILQARIPLIFLFFFFIHVRCSDQFTRTSTNLHVP